MTALALDHLVIAVRNLDAASAAYQLLLGRSPSWRGEHPGRGTANVLFRLDNCYLELLALSDAPAEGESPFRDALQLRLASAGEGLFAVAIGADDLDATVAEVRARRIDAHDPVDGEGSDAESGAHRQWRNAHIPLDQSRGVPLFFIQHRWGELPEAALAAESGAYVAAVDHTVVASPDVDAALVLWRDKLGLDLRLSRDFPGGRRIHFLRLGESILELVGSTGVPAEGHDALWGVAFRVGDIDKTVDRLRLEGVNVSDVRDGAAPGTRVADLKPGYSCDVRVLFIQKDVA
jgi:catechol 2,3-dioxygenase-like lactoylglutathione lyase family enzyme